MLRSPLSASKITYIMNANSPQRMIISENIDEAVFFLSRALFASRKAFFSASYLPFIGSVRSYVLTSFAGHESVKIQR